jgi:hypothetical protein
MFRVMTIYSRILYSSGTLPIRPSTLAVSEISLLINVHSQARQQSTDTNDNESEQRPTIAASPHQMIEIDLLKRKRKEEQEREKGGEGRDRGRGRDMHNTMILLVYTSSVFGQFLDPMVSIQTCSHTHSVIHNSM